MNAVGFSSIPDWLILLAVLLLGIYIYRYVTRDWGYFDAQNIKSIGKVPFIGYAWQIPRYNLTDIDSYYYKKWKVWGAFELMKPTLIVGDLRLIKLLTIQDFGNFTDRRTVSIYKNEKITRLFLTGLEGEEWRVHRNVLSPTFTSGKLRQISSIMEECANIMVLSFRNELKTGVDSIDAKEWCGMYTMDVIARCCFGYEINTKANGDPFVEHAKKLIKPRFSLSLLLLFLAPKLHAKLGLSNQPADNLTYFSKVIEQVVRRRKQENARRYDFLQLLLDAQMNEENDSTESDKQKISSGDAKPLADKKKVLSGEAVVAHALLFLIAGFDATANTICYAIYFMARYPQHQEKLANEVRNAMEKHGHLSYEVVMELPYLNKVISETLRMYPVALRLERRCTRACKLGEIYVRKDMLVSVPVYSIHHDESYYPNPEVFDPERFSPENKASRDPLTYIPFGAGPRNCVGMRFALLEVKIAVAYLIHSFVVSPSKKTEMPLKFRKGVGFLLPENGVHLKFEERKRPERLDAS